MKNVIIIIILTLVVISSCEKVIQLQLPNSQTLLVVDGGIFHNFDGTPSTQQIKLTTSQQFFSENEFPEVTDAIVSVSDGQDEVIFDHVGEGLYEATDFISEEGKTYTLNINYQGQIFEASETLAVGVAIDNIYSEFDEGGDLFSDANPGYAVKLDFTDPKGVENFYLWKLYVNGEYIIQPDPSNKFSAISKDEFFDGQTLIGLRAHEEFLAQIGDQTRTEQYSISASLYDYYFAFFSLTGGEGLLGDPPPAGLRGNVRNINNPDNNALGYFQVASFSFKDFVIE